MKTRLQIEEKLKEVKASFKEDITFNQYQYLDGFKTALQWVLRKTE